jgi:hypothetical protein
MKKIVLSVTPQDTANYATSLKEAGFGLLATLGIKLIQLGGKHPKLGESSQVLQHYKENQGWENSSQRYELECEFLDEGYFEDMSLEELFWIIRRQENFLMERGIRYPFIHNFSLALHAFDKLKDEDNCNSGDT